MILTKGIEIRALEAEFLRLGGEIDRTNRGHVMFKCPGLPTVGVHVTRVRAPRRLISMLRKMQAGTTVSPTRQPEPATQGASGDVLEVERPRAIQRPNPQRPASMTAPHNPESVKEAAAELERRKAHDRAVALARALNRPEPPPYQPYVAQEEPLAWREDVMYGPTISDPLIGHDILNRAFEDAERDGMVKWYVDAGSCLEEMSAMFPHDASDKLPRGCLRYGVAIVRPAPYGLMAVHTYVRGRYVPGCLPRSEDPADKEIYAVVTVTPAEFARFKAGWECGIDYVRRLARAAGVAD
jgi:hypothetical protein